MQESGKFLVIKNSDIDEFLSDDMKIRLRRMFRRIQKNRENNGKPAMNQYLVVNQDEPFIQSMFNIMRDNGIDIQ